MGERFPNTPPLDNGTSYRPEFGSYALDSRGTCTKHHGAHHHHHPSPKLDFLQFDGENPKA